MNLSAAQLRELHASLLSEAAQLERRLNELTHPPGSVEMSLPQHAGDGESEAQTDVLNDEALSEALRLQQALKQVRQALVKMDQGSYGSCSACGLNIGFPRLSVSASTALCIDWQCSSELQRAS